MAVNLFAAAQDATVKKDSLVEFRAGCMNMNPNSKLVTADHRKGLVQLKAEDGLVQFNWKDRVTNQLEIDDAVFRKVNEAKGRVYVLEFKEDVRKKLFFWMQEPSDEKDEQLCTEVNKFINNPPQPGAGNGNGAGGLDPSTMDQNQLLQFLASQGGAGGANLNGIRELLQRRMAQGGGGGGGGSGTQPRRAQQPSGGSSGTATRATGSSSGGTSGASNADALKRVIGNVSSLAKENPEPSLPDIVNVEEILKSGLLDDENVVKVLLEFLPEGTPLTIENLRDNLNSAQFKEAVRNFHQALKSGEIASIAMSFGLDASTMGPNSTIEDFLLAIQKEAKKKSTPDAQTNSK